MIQGHIKGQAKNTNAAPQKKVTFYGPVMTTKGEKLRHVGTKITPRKITLLSSALKSRSKEQVVQPIQHTELQSVNDDLSKPHSKITVTGIPAKTRLNCNHLRPKCQCSTIGNKRRMSKGRQKSAMPDAPKRILISTRSLPRGELNGRKNYKEKGDSLSILDANWRPGLDTYTKDAVDEILNNDHKLPLDVNKENVESSTGNSKKKVQFAGENNTHDGSRKKNDHRQNNSHINNPKESNTSQSFKNNSNNTGTLDSYESAPSGYQLEPQNTRDDSDNPMTDSHERKIGEYCRLCESLRDDYPDTSTFNRMNYNIDDHDDECLSDHIQYSSKYISEEPCLLCRRYGRWHYCNGEKECCELCEGHNIDSHTSCDSDEATVWSPLHKARSPLQRKLSTPMLSSDNEEPLFTKRIPYEPRTQLVKNLKQKLEENYRNDDYMRRRNQFRRRWRSWDVEDLEDFRRSRLHNYRKTQDRSPHHKCIHRYLQNDRLFMEPAKTDRKGRSVCSECGAPQPTDPEKDPYLYHITLGEMKDSDSVMGPVGKQEKVWKKKSARGSASTGTNTAVYHQASAKPRRDTSKHIYAKLNKNINNIFPGGSGYSLRPWAADKLRYHGDPHSKRHPSKSMALIDHIV